MLELLPWCASCNDGLGDGFLVTGISHLCINTIYGTVLPIVVIL